MYKEYKEVSLEIKADDVTEDGTFIGYGSTFGGTPDSHGDVISRGAFLESLEKGGRNGTGVVMLWQHNSSEPIGKWLEISENSQGLKVKGKLSLGIRRADEAYILLRDKVIKGLSIGFNIPEGGSKYNPEKRTRTIKKANLWEISLVTFPANIRAKINNVKSYDEAKTEREIEELLRESGVSRQVAVKVSSMCKPYLKSKHVISNSENNTEGVSIEEKETIEIVETLVLQELRRYKEVI